MRTIIALCTLAALAGCTTYRDPAEAAYPNLRAREEVVRERHQDTLRRLQDEFNAIHGES